MAKTPKMKKRSLVKKVKEEQQEQPEIDYPANKKPKTEEPENPQPLPPQQNQQQQPQEIQQEPPLPLLTETTDSGYNSDSESLPKLLEPYSKDQLIELISNAAQQLPSLIQHIREAADRDISHRKIFVHGLGWETTRQTLLSAFEPFGEIEDCTLVIDKVTGKAKGYGFVLFKTRKGAVEALKNPKKKIGNRFASWQLASVGPGAPAQAQDTSARRIYVSNVPPDTDAEKLRQFFAKYGEIETGPFGFDSTTGKSRGFAFFVYKSEAGAKKVLEEPYKMFEGHRLNCQKATDGKGKIPVQMPVQAPLQPQAPQVLAAAQNLALFGQHPSLNPLYSGFITSPGAGFFANAGPVNPALVAGALKPGMIPTQVGGNQSVLGAYGGLGTGLQHVYPNTQMGQPSAAMGTQGGGGSFSGYPPYM